MGQNARFIYRTCFSLCAFSWHFYHLPFKFYNTWNWNLTCNNFHLQQTSIVLTTGTVKPMLTGMRSVSLCPWSVYIYSTHFSFVPIRGFVPWMRQKHHGKGNSNSWLENTQGKWRCTNSYLLELLASIRSCTVLPLECSFPCLGEDENRFIKELIKQNPGLIVGWGWEHGVKKKDNFILIEHFKCLISHNNSHSQCNDHYEECITWTLN